MQCFFIQTNVNSKTLVLGESHDTTSLLQFQCQLGAITMDQYQLEISPDINKKIIEEGSVDKLIFWLAKQFPDKSLYIDLPKSSEFIGLDFSLRSLFTTGSITEEDQQKTQRFFQAIGEAFEIDKFLENQVIAWMYKIKAKLLASELDLSSTAIALKECIKRSGGIDTFINYLKFTTTGMYMRNNCMARHMFEKIASDQKITAIAIVGNDHLDAINAILKIKIKENHLSESIFVGDIESYDPKKTPTFLRKK